MATGIDLSRLHAGLKGTTELLVGEEHTAPQVGSGRIHVLATPVMINLIEAAALAAVEHLLPAGHQSLGTHLELRHIAATPVGMMACTSAWSSTWSASTCACSARSGRAGLLSRGFVERSS